MNFIRVRLCIRGKVQGVWFRAHTQIKADEWGVKGWVANESDGTVTVVAEGPENQVNTLIDWCQSGPTGSRVDKVEVHAEPYCGEFSAFEIRY